MRTMKWACLMVVAIVLVLMAGRSVAAQVNTADLSGQVTDPQGKAVPKARVMVKNLATGISRTVESDADGNYKFVGLAPGRYELRVEGGTGLAKLVNPEIVLTIGQSAEFNAHLQLQSGSESVTVTGEAELIESARTAATETVGQRQIENLPINGRNYINFTLTNSQARRDDSPSIGAAPNSGLNINGQRARSNAVSVDGANYNDDSVRGIRATVSQEAVQEFQIILNNYMPEFGQASGGVINIVTKGGSNEIHGNVFGYLRHKSIQARNPFSVTVDPATGNLIPSKQAFTRVQAGFTIGGPIVRDKSFYFVSYENTHRQETGFSSIGQGNFGFSTASIPCLPFPITLTSAQFTFYNAALGPAAAAGACGTAGAQQAVGAALLTSASSNVAINADMNKNSNGSTVPISTTLGIPAAFGSQLFPPLPGGPVVPLPSSFVGLNSLRGNFPVSEATSFWSARLDHQWSTRNSTFVRANFSPSNITGIQVNAQNQSSGTNAASRTSQQNSHDWAGVVQHVTSFASTFFNEARFQAARRGLHYGFASFPGGANVAVDILGVASFGREPFTQLDRIERRFQWTDNMTWVKGSHTFKWGVDFNLLQVRSSTNQIFQLDFGGLFRVSALSASSTGLPTNINAVQAYGLGIPGGMLQGIGASGRTFNNNQLGIFAQDSWKIHRRFTLNYGVRYDLEFSPIFTPGTAINSAAEKALGVFEGIQRDKNNVAPRIGVAIDPFGDDKTVIRAGYGLFYDHPPLAVPFLAATADGALSVQQQFGPGLPSASTLTPLNALSLLNAGNIFQGALRVGSFANLCYQTVSPGGQANPQRFDPLCPNSFFINQNFLSPTAGLPLAFLPFTFPVAGNFQYGYAQQADLVIERQFANDFRISVGYAYLHGAHLNRSRNMNVDNPKLLAQNFINAKLAGLNFASPLLVQAPLSDTTANPPTVPCGVAVVAPGALGTLSGASCPNAGQFVGTAAMFNFFRPSGPNPSFGILGLPLATLQALATAAGYPAGPGIPIPFSDVDQQESSGMSIYHGLTFTVSKRFGHHFEFLSSYTWSHAIDDSTDLQSPLAPQDNSNVRAERSNSSFDQRHRWVLSGVFESPYKHSDSGAWHKVFADFNLAPILEVSSGRPFNVLSANDFNLDFGPTTDRPSIVSSGGVTSPFIPGVQFGLPTQCPVPAAAPFGCTGNLSRNAFTRPKFVNLDLRISRRIFLTERWSLDVIADAFNIFNRNNIQDVSVLCDPTATCTAGQPTSSFDPRQFQFALKINW
jgi:hypothetical protein